MSQPARLSLLLCLPLCAAEFELPLQVSNLPEAGRFLVLQAELDLGTLFDNQGGTVDERSFELIDSATGERLPHQFTSKRKSRIPGRPLPPGTPSSVSFAAEFPPTSTPESLQPEGTLTWIASGPSLQQEFLLRFRTPVHGTFVQVPFPPENAVHFDGEAKAAEPAWFPEMQLRPQWPFAGKIDVLGPDGLITSWHLGPDAPGSQPHIRRPFLYPLNGPGGISLTEFGKPHDPTGSHAHHYSLWIAHANVNGNDFWSERGGTIHHVRLEEMLDGRVFARLKQATSWVFQNEELLNETRAFTFYNTPERARVIDVDLRFRTAGTNNVTFGKSSFGFLAARVAQSMTVFDGGGEITNSHGEINEHQAHLKRAKWIDQSGPVTAGQWAGITLFDHPSNPNHPSGWHCRNDGWACASFSMVEPYELQAGQELALRYRILLHEGNAREAQLGTRFLEFAASPEVKIGTPRKLSD